MPLLTLKVDVDTLRGTREGLPNLARLLQQHQANATFLFTLGPDHTGWALRRAFRSGFLKKVSRTSVIKHYGLKTLMYGVLLPAPDIGTTCAAELRAIAADGFECGIHCWDHVVWQDNVRQRDAAWTIKQMTQAIAQFTEIFGQEPTTHGAAGWQMNVHAFKALDALAIRYASDSRCLLNADGTLAHDAAGPYRINASGVRLSCIQLPTTLPTLDELIGRSVNGGLVTESNVADVVLKLTETPRDHVFTLHAELEGQKLAGVFKDLIVGWQAQGYDLVSMADYFQKIRNDPLPYSPVAWGEMPGRSGDLIIQSPSMSR